MSEQIDTDVLKNFIGVDEESKFLEEIRKERPYFNVIAEKTAETLDSIFSAKPASKGGKPSATGVAKPRVRKRRP